MKQSTEDWARELGIATQATAPPVPCASQLCRKTALEVASRALVLQGVVAVACGVDAEPVTTWLREQNLWPEVTRQEKAFLQASTRSPEASQRFHWRQEAEWTLLWVAGMVESLGLPTRCCDTRRLVDEIVPALGASVQPFLDRAVVRPDAELLGEDDRTYNLWCHAVATRRAGAPLPADLNWGVLYQRRYAFEWLDGIEEWDEVACDA